MIKLIEARVLERRILRRLRNKQAFSETDKNNENLSVRKDLENISGIIKI